MKKMFFLLLAQLCLCSSLFSQDLETQISTAVSTLNAAKINTGILYEKVHHPSPNRKFP
ncbi:MAG: hypothetical protein KA974_03525 [Saprospiraceae bacterium]|nr:hypothetical protein [Saprospiraceae bacterium]MBP7680176.1 hypothetical protein [Saprospiraceae bacterium]